MQGNGFKQSKAPSTKDRIRQLEADLKNSQMALNVNQMMMKQLMQQIDLLRQDSVNTLNLANDLQYRTLAMIKLQTLDTDALDAEADTLKLKDYNDASDKEDAEKGYTVGDTVKEESIIVITSTTDTDVDQGLFRSKIPVSQIPYEEMKKDVMGKVPGDKFEADINGVKHMVELLDIRELPVALELVADDDQDCTDECEGKCTDCACDKE